MKETGSLWVLLLAAALAAGACGKKGAPLPPFLRIPGPVETPNVMRVGDDVFVRLTVPKANVDGNTPADIGRIELYAITPDRVPTEFDDPEDVRKLSTLIGSEQVRKPAPPLPPLKEGQPAPPPIPLGPGVDQGAFVAFTDTLTPETWTIVPMPLPKDRPPEREVEFEVEPLPGPLVAPTESPDPIRYYYAVGVSPSGRYGPMAAFVPVPLGPTSTAPSAPTASHDETTLTIQWTPALDARGVTLPPIEGALESKPTVPGPPTTTYDVYEVPRATNKTPPMPAPANGTPSMPVALTPAPIGAVEFKQPLEEFGVERCFFVRPVDIVNGYHVRGPASETVCITPADTFPPAAPKSLGAVASASAINLIWEPSTQPDLAGYLVLRADAPGGTLTPLTAAPITETTYPDRDVKPGVTYTYAVVAVDAAGNRSAESNRIEETARQ